jgi:hypothetical protein
MSICYFRKLVVFLSSSFSNAKKDAAMVIEIDKTVTSARLKQSLKSIKAARAKVSRSKMSEFFGALPHIGDGLAFQKKARNEWH